MEVSRPFFSIVIPTRNRASLLRSSLRTALDQAFDDFEVVVCDNNSSDDTRAVVESFMARHDRLRYVNPGRDLSMCDNWDFALEQAAGAYITYLSDDDGLILEALPYIYSLISKFEIKVLTWPCAYYHHMDVPEEKKKGALYCDITSGKLFEVPSEIIIEGLSNFDGMHFVIPKGLNCVFARSVLDKPLKTAGRFFPPPFPDYSAAYHVLGALDSYHFIDVPLYVSGTSSSSNTGMRYARKETCDHYLSLFDHDLLAGCPYQLRYLITSYLLPTFLTFQKYYPQKMGMYRPNIDAFLKKLFAELVTYGDYEDISEELSQLASYMREHFGGDQVFQELWKEHLASRKKQENGHRMRQLSKKTKDYWRRNETLYRLAKKAKDLVAPPRPTYYEYRGLASMFEVSQVLTETLRPIMKDPGNLTPLRATSHEFLRPHSPESQVG